MKSPFTVAALLVFSAFGANATDQLRLHFDSSRSGIVRADKALDQWLKIRARRDFSDQVRAIINNQAISRAQSGIADMRDAVASLPEVAATTGPAGTESAAVCTTLENCPVRVGAAHSEDIQGLSAAIVKIIRPWILLQHRRGGEILLDRKSDVSGVLATIKLEGLVSVPVDICVSPAPMGGLSVWLRSVADLDDIYAFSREATLHPAQQL